MNFTSDSNRHVRIELGKTWLDGVRASRLVAGSVIELDCPADGDVEILVDGRRVAVGRVTATGGKLGVWIREVRPTE